MTQENHKRFWKRNLSPANKKEETIVVSHFVVPSHRIVIGAQTSVIYQQEVWVQKGTSVVILWDNKPAGSTAEIHLNTCVPYVINAKISRALHTAFSQRNTKVSYVEDTKTWSLEITYCDCEEGRAGKIST